MLVVDLALDLDLVVQHDYCYSLFVGALLFTLNRLQRIQNAATRLVAGRARKNSVCSESRRWSLHWLLIRERIH